jgi:GntR family transcriptional regulator
MLIEHVQDVQARPYRSLVTIDPLGPVPPYKQLAAILRERIEVGKLQPGERLPSELALQQTYDLARGTVRRAVELLRSEGLVFTVPTRGTYVAERDED